MGTGMGGRFSCCLNGDQLLGLGLTLNHWLKQVGSRTGFICVPAQVGLTGNQVLDKKISMLRSNQMVTMEDYNTTRNNKDKVAKKMGKCKTCI